MTVLSAQTIRRYNIVEPLVDRSDESGLTYGLSPAGYDVRLVLENGASQDVLYPGEFMLAATVEHFNMPNNVLGVVHDKSSLVRRGLSVHNTVIEPGWRGFLTLELRNESKESIHLYAGQAIAQVVFHMLDLPTCEPYGGKYQDQEFGPQKARK